MRTIIAVAVILGLLVSGRQSAVAVPVGFAPRGVGVNPVTDHVYVANFISDSVSVINGTTEAVVATIPVLNEPHEVGVNPATNRVYVTHQGAHAVAVIDGATEKVIATIPVGSLPWGVAVNHTTNRIYVANHLDNSVSVIDGTSETVVATVPVGPPYSPEEVGASSATNRIYVTFPGWSHVSVIDGATEKVIARIEVGFRPEGVAANPTTERIYVAINWSHNISVLYENELMMNPSFDSGFAPWRARNLGPDDGKDLDSIYEGDASVRLTGAAGVHKALVQRVRTTGRAGTVLNVAAVSKAQDASPTGGAYKVRVRVTYTDSTAESFEVHFHKSTHDWRRKTASFTAAKDFDRLTVSVIFENQTGTAWFDALHLWRNP